jgi:hypothetical protein
MAAIDTISGGSYRMNDIIFSEFQARVFNQVEALYRVNGYLSTPLFENSFLLSKATATYILDNVGVSGASGGVGTTALDVYRAVLGISAPVNVPEPELPISSTGAVNNGFAASTPTTATPPTAVPSGTSVPTSIASTDGGGSPVSIPGKSTFVL